MNPVWLIRRERRYAELELSIETNHYLYCISRTHHLVAEHMDINLFPFLPECKNGDAHLTVGKYLQVIMVRNF